MFEKVLIAEDFQHANEALRATLRTLGIENTVPVYYCDQAFSWLKLALKDNQPYDLLITDLSFAPDGGTEELAGGRELIAAARQIQPMLKILVFSMEQRPFIVEPLFADLMINGYVCKGRHDARNLQTALTDIAEGRIHRPPFIKAPAGNKNAVVLTTYDLRVIKLLAEGNLQKNLPAILEREQLKPFGMSSIEKRLNGLRESLGFKKNEQLVAYCMERELI